MDANDNRPEFKAQDDDDDNLCFKKLSHGYIHN